MDDFFDQVELGGAIVGVFILAVVFFPIWSPIWVIGFIASMAGIKR